MPRLVVPNVDEELRRRFKVWCINHNTTMKDQIIAFMEKTVEDDAERLKRGNK